MELRQLEYFVTVAEEGSFTGAAARLYVAQPGVSAQVRRLEKELGEELLDRSDRVIRLTRVGEAVLPHARAALDGANGVHQVLDELTGLLHGRIAIGVVPVSRGLNLATLLADFHKSHPAMEIVLTENGSAELISQLRAGQLDAAVFGLAETVPSGLSVQVIVDEPLVVAAPPGDPLTGRKPVPLTALRDRALISLPPGSGIRACIDEACARAGFVPRIAFEASSPSLLAELAIRGLGPAIIPASLAARYAGDLEAVAIADPALRGRLALGWRDTGPASPAARAFVSHARAALSALAS